MLDFFSLLILSTAILLCTPPWTVSAVSLDNGFVRDDTALLLVNGFVRDDTVLLLVNGFVRIDTYWHISHSLLVSVDTESLSFSIWHGCIWVYLSHN